MRKGHYLILLLLLSAVVLANSGLESQIQKITYYAQEYETGNIDYVQLMIYISSAREGLNEILGVTSKEMGGILKQEQLEKILGEPTEETKWVWVEGQDQEKKLDDYVPAWRKIVFDGKKIQIRMEAYPSIFSKQQFEDEESYQSKIEEGSIIYRLHFQTEFKKPQDQLDIDSKIEEIKSIAEKFNEEPTNANAEELAKESVNAERIFQNYFQQGSGNCEDIMISIFGNENLRETQEIISNRFTFFEGENFEAIMQLEMCDECEWNWINLNMWIEGRGKFQYPGEEAFDTRQDENRFKQLTDAEFKAEVIKILETIKESLGAEQYAKALQSSRTLNTLNNAWSENSNNVWDEVREEFEAEIESMSDEERYEFDQNYGWIKQDQEQRQAVREIQEEKYEERKEFYLDLFSEYDTKELFYTQTNFEKRLIEEFKENGEEVCDNNQDDNENEQVDCEESQCGGKICGSGTREITNGNTTEEIEVDFYCIQSVCQAKEEIKEAEPICGNHICEEDEADSEDQNGTCQSDCSFAECPTYDAIECSGKVIFEGEDENGCQLPPICIDETETCTTTEDCIQPSCGVSECIKEESEDEQGECKVTELIECTAECESWEQEIETCNNQKIITKICEEGQWKETGSECEEEQELDCVKCGNGCITTEESMVASCLESTEDFECESQNGECRVIKEDFPEPVPMPVEPIVGDECIMANDCGGEDDVCSNGKCIQIPKAIEEDHEEEEQENSPDETGIFGGFKIFLNRLTITGRAVNGETTDSSSSDSEEEEAEEDSTEEDSAEEESDSEEDTTSKDDDESDSDDDSNKECPDAGDPPEEKDGCWYEETFDDQGCVSGYDYFCDEKDDREEDYEKFEDDSEFWEEIDKEERERHEKESRQRCEKDCERPCIEKCIRATCGEEMDCDIDTESKTCERSCVADDKCINKCTSGEPNWWEEFQSDDMHKEEKGVFTVGGGCREEQGKSEGYIWFGGWGDPFERIQGLKQQYYAGGNSDWCKQDLENLIRQREEFEKGFNQEFAIWFFEKYLPNSAKEWKQAQSGIYEAYWNSVDMQRQLAERMNCVEENNIENVMDINLINIEYETEFGKLEYWEEVKEVEMDWMDGKVTIISPYMKVWIFPSEEFIKYEMQSAMEEGRFPGSEEKIERENEEGFTEEEKEMMREDEDFMELIEETSNEYGGNADIASQIVDEETGEIIFNMHIQINKEDIIGMTPMLPKELPTSDITIQLDFEKLYNLIDFAEKDMSGAQLESPPWDHQPRQGTIKGMTDGINMYFKIRSLINSAEVTPSSARGEVRDVIWFLIKMMGDKGDDEREEFTDDKDKEGPQEQSPTTEDEEKPAFKF